MNFKNYLYSFDESSRGRDVLLSYTEDNLDMMVGLNLEPYQMKLFKNPRTDKSYRYLGKPRGSFSEIVEISDGNDYIIIQEMDGMGTNNRTPGREIKISGNKKSLKDILVYDTAWNPADILETAGAWAIENYFETKKEMTREEMVLKMDNHPKSKTRDFTVQYRNRVLEYANANIKPIKGLLKSGKNYQMERAYIRLSKPINTFYLTRGSGPINNWNPADIYIISDEGITALGNYELWEKEWLASHNLIVNPNNFDKASMKLALGHFIAEYAKSGDILPLSMKAPNSAKFNLKATLKDPTAKNDIQTGYDLSDIKITKITSGGVNLGGFEVSTNHSAGIAPKYQASAGKGIEGKGCTFQCRLRNNSKGTGNGSWRTTDMWQSWMKKNKVVLYGVGADATALPSGKEAQFKLFLKHLDYFTSSVYYSNDKLLNPIKEDPRAWFDKYHNTDKNCVITRFMFLGSVVGAVTQTGDEYAKVICGIALKQDAKPEQTSLHWEIN